MADSKSLLFAQVKELICRSPGDQRRLLDTLTVQCEEPYLMPYLKFVQTEIEKCRWVQEKVPRDLHVSDRQHLCRIHEIFRSNFKRTSIDEQQPQSLDRLYCIRSLTSFAPDHYLSECSAHFETRFAVFYDQTLFLVRIQASKNAPSVWMVNQASCLVHVATSNTTLRLPHFPFVYKDGFLCESGAESNKSLFWDLTTYQATQKVGVWTWTNPDELMPCPGYPLQVNLVATMANNTAYYLIATSISRMALLSVQFSPETKALKIFRKDCTFEMSSQRVNGFMEGMLNQAYKIWAFEDPQLVLFTSHIKTYIGCNFFVNIASIGKDGLDPSQSLKTHVLTFEYDQNQHEPQGQVIPGDLKTPIPIQHLGMIFLLIQGKPGNLSVLLIRNMEITRVNAVGLLPSARTKLNFPAGYESVSDFPCWINPTPDVRRRIHKGKTLRYELGYIRIKLRR